MGMSQREGRHEKEDGAGAARANLALRRVPRRGARDAPAKPRGRAPREAPEGRDPLALTAERRRGTLVHRAVGAGPAQVPEPGDRDGPGDRGADRPGEGQAGGRRARRGVGSVRGGDRVLRRPRDERQRGRGARPAGAPDHRPRAHPDRARERHDRLDGPRERPRPPARPREAHPPQARLSTRQAGDGDPDRSRAGGGSLGALGCRPGPRHVAAGIIGVRTVAPRSTPGRGG